MSKLGRKFTCRTSFAPLQNNKAQAVKHIGKDRPVRAAFAVIKERVE